MVLPRTQLAANRTMMAEVWVGRYFEGAREVRLDTRERPREEGLEVLPSKLTVAHTPPAQPAALPDYELESRQIALTITRAEGIMIFPDLFAEELTGQPGHPVAAVAGAEGAALVDLEDGAEDDVVAMSDPQYLVQCLWSPADNAAALVGVGPEGCTVVPYDTATSTWGSPMRLFDGENCTDVVPVGDDRGVVAEVLVVNHASNYYVRIARDAGGSYGVVPGSQVNGSGIQGATGALVSVCQPDASGPVLACTLGGDVWQMSGSTGTRVSATGDQPRRLRACGAYAAVSSFGPGTGLGFGGVNFCERGAQGAWAFAFGYSWSEGPLGLDCTPRPDGNVLFVTPNFNTAEYRLNEIDAAGNVVRDDVVDAPLGCTSPGHAACIDFHTIGLSCNQANVLEVIDLDAP